ncbi:AAA family ATPase [Amedibacillus sp. YH-ame6]
MDFGNFLIDSIQMKYDEQRCNEYPFNVPLIKNFRNLEFRKRVTILLGENGIGKSTLLEALAVNRGFNSEGGGRDYNFMTYDETFMLSDYLTVHRTPEKMKTGFFLRTETMYNLNTKLFEYYEDEVIKVNNHLHSHGESILEVIKMYFQEDGFYIMDEPESALSPSSLFALINIIHELSEAKNCQFLIATHSPILAGYPLADLIEVDEDGIMNRIKYEESNLYLLYSRYIKDKAFRSSLYVNDNIEE